jgi:gliding motility associated protien GldN
MNLQLFTSTCAIVAMQQFAYSQTGSSNVLYPDPCASDRINRPPVAFSPLRQGDVMWSKRTWRVIDLREKMNHSLYYPEEAVDCKMNLFDVLKSGILEHGLTAFANPVFDDEFRSPMSKAEVSSLLVSWDSLNQVEDVNNPGTYITVPLKKEITGMNIRQYWIKEDWFFDKQRSVMDFRIVGICPLAEKLSESGEVIGLKPLFWIYFPDARIYMAKAAAFNFHNDAEPMSFDELFFKRKFSSYIYKESNVYDRTIADNKRGIDALLESESIKEDIFKYEEDLWHR